jgi:tight adherence protein B
VKRILVALTLALAAALPAVAAAGVRIAKVDTNAYPTVRVTVITSSPSTKPPLLRENGVPVEGLTAENLAHGANVVVAIDRSQSMKGKALADASAAARSFVANKPYNTDVEVVAFGHRGVALTGMEQATIDADQALRTIAVDAVPGTAMWDAVVLASHALAAQQSGGRVLVLLTDGQATVNANKASLDDAIATARDAGVAVYPIGIESAQFNPAPLRRLASETGGSYHAASSSALLTQVYGDVARELERTWRISYPTAARPGDNPMLDATVAGLGGAQQRLQLPASLGATASPSASPLVPTAAYSDGIGTLAVMLLVGLAVLCAVGLIFASTGSGRLKRRIDPHVGAPKKKQAPTKRNRLAAASGVMNATENAFARFSLFPKLQLLIDRADLPLRAVELFYMCVGAAFVPSLLLAVGGAPTVLLVLTMAIGGLLPVGVVWFKARRRLAEIDTALPDLLVAMAASLKAGHSFRQGIQAAANEDQGPLTKELKRVLTETSLGRPMDDALQEMAARIGSKDVNFVITAVTIQRQVGGSLAGIFDLVADTVRQRQQFARKIRGLTAMGRMSAYTLIGLPFFLAFALTAINPRFMSPLWKTGTGHDLIFGGLVMMALGSLVLKKIVSFKG